MQSLLDAVQLEDGRIRDFRWHLGVHIGFPPFGHMRCGVVNLVPRLLPVSGRVFTYMDQPLGDAH